VLVGVVNNSASTVSSLALTGSDIFGFDGDGICTFTFVGSAIALPARPRHGSGGLPGSDFDVAITNATVEP